MEREENSEIDLWPAVFESFSPEEDLSDANTLEEELDKAQEQNSVERMVLLQWFRRACTVRGKIISGKRGYSPTEKFNSEFENLVLPILNKAAFREDELNARLTPEQFERIDGRNMTLNPDDWTFL